MQVGETILLADRKHKAIVTKVISNQSFIIECIDKVLTFTRLVEIEDLKRGIPFGSWIYIFYRN